MFNVGDIICYPMHGAGKIEAIEKKEVLGNMGEYYILYFYFDGIQISVPLDKAPAVGLRSIINDQEVVEVFERLRQQPEEEDGNWNRRYRANLDKLRTGEALLIAEVIKTLFIRNQNKGLSAGEKKMLENARRFLIGELVYAGGKTEDEVISQIDECLELCCAP